MEPDKRAEALASKVRQDLYMVISDDYWTQFKNDDNINPEQFTLKWGGGDALMVIKGYAGDDTAMVAFVAGSSAQGVVRKALKAARRGELKWRKDEWKKASP